MILDCLHKIPISLISESFIRQRLTALSPVKLPVPRAQRNHFDFVIRVFVRLEMNWFDTDISWYEIKLSIICEAVRPYLAAPTVNLASTA